MIGVCPQFNVQFEVLTVKENLKTFAEIKGIKSREVEREVSACSPEMHQQQRKDVGKPHVSVKTLCAGKFKGPPGRVFWQSKLVSCVRQVCRQGCGLDAPTMIPLLNPRRWGDVAVPIAAAPAGVHETGAFSPRHG